MNKKLSGENADISGDSCETLSPPTGRQLSCGHFCRRFLSLSFIGICNEHYTLTQKKQANDNEIKADFSKQQERI